MFIFALILPIAKYHYFIPKIVKILRNDQGNSQIPPASLRFNLN